MTTDRTVSAFMVVILYIGGEIGEQGLILLHYINNHYKSAQNGLKNASEVLSEYQTPDCELSPLYSHKNLSSPLLLSVLRPCSSSLYQGDKHFIF